MVFECLQEWKLHNLPCSCAWLAVKKVFPDIQTEKFQVSVRIPSRTSGFIRFKRRLQAQFLSTKENIISV